MERCKRYLREMSDCRITTDTFVKWERWMKCPPGTQHSPLDMRFARPTNAKAVVP
jgi:hypothetical protein